MISLYFHIPFCTKKCPYCHFYVVPNKPLFHTLLEEALLKEWELYLPLIRGKKVVSIYFGGGTPSLFAPHGIQTLLTRIRETALLDENVEITLEANPENGTDALFASLREMGINRLSLGVQSLDDRFLHTLERTHSAKRALEAILSAHKAGFQNISIDLMYDLPDQTEASWQYTLDQVSSLPIQHLSLYNLTIEPHTSFHKRKVVLPENALSARLLERALLHLETIGLKRYEISAFSLPGFESKHNTGYWTGRPFLGLGPSAFSYWEGERFKNVSNLQRYARSLKENTLPVDFRETLPFPQNLQERLAVHLRLLTGAPLAKFADMPESLKKNLETLKDQGLLSMNAESLQLTEKGLQFYDTVAAEII